MATRLLPKSHGHRFRHRRDAARGRKHAWCLDLISHIAKWYRNCELRRSTTPTLNHSPCRVVVRGGGGISPLACWSPPLTFIGTLSSPFIGPSPGISGLCVIRRLRGARALWAVEIQTRFISDTCCELLVKDWGRSGRGQITMP